MANCNKCLAYHMGYEQLYHWYNDTIVIGKKWPEHYCLMRQQGMDEYYETDKECEFFLEMSNHEHESEDDQGQQKTGEGPS